MAPAIATLPAPRVFLSPCTRGKKQQKNQESQKPKHTTGLRRPTQPDPWVREEFEVETGRVVHQETIEGEPPRH